MAATLPRNIQLKLEQTLSQWQAWRYGPGQRPEVLRQLSPGLSNHSILVASERRYVVRIDGINPTMIGLSRQAEWRAWQSAAAAGIAPTPCYFNPELGSLVYEYAEADAQQEQTTTEIATLLREIHSLPAVHFRLDLRERMLRYRRHVEHSRRELTPAMAHYFPAVSELIDGLAEREQSLVLCHNDLLAANRLRCKGRLQAIDWEYCAMGSTWFDLAVVSAGDEMSESATSALLIQYLQRTPTPAEEIVFAQYQVVYRYLELLWFSALENEAARNSALTREKLQSLEQAVTLLQ